MNEFYVLLIFSLLPALGTFVGGAVAEIFTISRNTYSLTLHAAAGIILAVISVVLLPEALKTTSPTIIVLAFIAGGIFFITIDNLINFIQGRSGNEDSTTAWAIFMGVTLDSFTDGLMIGTGALINIQLGLFLALGVVLADIPEGFANIAAFKEKNMDQNVRIILNFLASLPVLGGALLGYFLISGEPLIVKYAVLAFTAGVLLTVTAEEIIPESHRNGEARVAALVLVVSFAVFVLLSTYIQI